MGGDRDHGVVGLVDDRRGVLEFQLVRRYPVNGQVGVEADAVGGGALSDVRRRQLDGETRVRVQAVAGGHRQRPRVGIARRDEGAQKDRGSFGLGNLPLLEGHETVQRRAERRLVHRQVVGRALPRIGATRDAVRPWHEHLAQVSRGTLIHGVGHHEFMSAVAQASQTGADGDDPRLVVPGL